MTELIKAFIIMQKTLLKIDRDPKTNAELSKSRVIFSMLQRANVRKDPHIVIYSDEAGMARGNGNGDSLNPVVSHQ